MKRRQELVCAMGPRYRQGSRSEKGRILDECCSVTGYHRKHVTRLLNKEPAGIDVGERSRHRIYGEAVREALVVIWEAADRICGKRLKAVLDDYIEVMERHGHLSLDPEVRRLLQRVSASTIDRLLSPVRARATGRRRRRGAASSSLKKQVPVRTFADWNDPEPGYLEIDLVQHSGGRSEGSCVHTLTLTDISSGWTECGALVVREQTLVTETISAVRSKIPFEVKGIDSDNDSVFLNETLIGYCREEGIEFTRSRAYRKNDQAWVEQKNGDVVRRFAGYERFEGIEAARLLMRLHEAIRLYVNFFQPSFKLLEKKREGAKVHKRYAPPATPCARLLQNPLVSAQIKDRLREERASLDPVKLLYEIRATQEALVALGERTDGEADRPQDLDEFLATLQDLWKQGEARPTHRRKPSTPRWWRTREDPFALDWQDVLEWLEEQPDITAREIFDRLQSEHPGRYADGQLRTLQRRVRAWRQVMARQLVYAGSKAANVSVPA